MLRVLYFTILIFLTTLCNGQAGNINPLIALAQNYSNEGRHHDSFDAYWLAFRQEPDNIEINYKLGIEAALISDYESAVMAFERVLLLDPGATQAKIDMAKAFYHLGAKKTAQHYLMEVLGAEDLPLEAKNNINDFLKSFD